MLCKLHYTLPSQREFAPPVLFLLYPGIRVAVPYFLFLSIFKDVLVRFWIFLAPTHKWKKIQLSLQDIMSRSSDYKMPFSSTSTNFMLLISKIYFWVCRANKTPPKIHGFKKMILAKYETERLISVDSETTSSFTRK